MFINMLFKKTKKIISRNKTLRSWWFKCKFWKRNGYWPNFKNPKTFNEKVNYRKNNARNNLFSVCSDKIAAKKWVAEQIGEKYIIPNYYVGDFISPDKIKQIVAENGDCFMKANHNSGAVYLITKYSSDDEIEDACNNLNSQLTIDFGEITNEPWYSEIKPSILVEKRLDPEDGESDIRDYKFHVFKQSDGKFKTIVAIDFDRNSNHSRSFFDKDFNYIHLSTHCPSVITSIPEPKNYKIMLELAEKLSALFSYARIDFYNVNGQIYFGEITFAPGSGFLGDFESYKYDRWMGNLWQGDPSY